MERQGPERSADGTGAHRKLIGGRYRPIRELGKGAFSSVLLAEDIVRGKEVAVKTLHDKYAGSEPVRRMLETESAALALADNDKIVRILDKGDGFIVLERLDGSPSSSFHYDEQGVLALASEACEALAAIHAKGIVHRDLKPDHLMIVHGSLKLIDFGYAKIAGEWDYSRSAGHDIGTPLYMAPEQTRNAWTVDGRADLYSLGIIMYEKLSGSVPFEDDDLKRIILMHRHDTPEKIRRAHPLVWGIISRALAKKPEDRFQSAEEMKAAIEKARGPV